MEELLIRDNYFPFDLQVLFNVYMQVDKMWGMPTIEQVRDLYDDHVRDRLNMFYYDMKPYELGRSGEHLIHNLRTYPEEVLRQLSDQIGMKALLETDELIEIFDYYNIFYKDDYDEYHNIPVRGVW